MSRPDDAPDDMTSSARIDDAYVERLLRRRGPSADADQDPAGSFVAAVADLGRSTLTPTGALAVLLAEGFDPAAVTNPTTGPPDRKAARRHTGRWAGLSLAARLSAVAGVALAGLTTAASAGVLPDQLQDRVGGLLEVTTPFEFPSAPEPTPATTPPVDGRSGTGPASELPGAPEPGPTRDVPQPTPAVVPTEPADPEKRIRPGTPPTPQQTPLQAPGRGAAPDGVPTPPAGPPQKAPGAGRAPAESRPARPPLGPGARSFGSRGQDPGPATTGHSTPGPPAGGPFD